MTPAPLTVAQFKTIAEIYDRTADLHGLAAARELVEKLRDLFDVPVSDFDISVLESTRPEKDAA